MSATQEVGEIFGEGSGPATALLRSPIVIIASIGLWGMNLYFFRLFHIDYKHALMNGTNLQPRTSHHMSSTAPTDDMASPSPKNRSSHGNTLVSSSSSSDGTPTEAVGSITKALIAEGGTKQIPASAVAQNLTPVNRGNRAVLSASSTPVTVSQPASDSKSRRDSSGAVTVSQNDSLLQEDFTACRLVCLSVFLFFLLQCTTFIWIDVLGGNFIGAIFAFYIICFVLAVLPYRSTKWIRRGVKLVWNRIMELLNPRCYCVHASTAEDGRPIPPKPVPFLDVFFADAMCSLSKVFFDWGLLWHMASHYPDPVPPDLHSIIIPSLCAAWPYIVRARQCLVMHTVGYYKKDPKRYQHVLNAIKYSTSLFPICVSAYQKTIDPAQHPTLAAFLEQFLVVLLVVNSLYAFAWDVSMDWGMLTDPYSLLLSTSDKAALLSSQRCQHKCLRPRLRFGIRVSLSILVVNFILRFAWLLRFKEKELFPSVDEFILMCEFLEVFRRALWNLLRVEWENIKIASHNETKDTHQTSVNDYDTNLQNAISMVPLASTSATSAATAGPNTALSSTNSKKGAPPLHFDMEKAISTSYSFGKT